LNRGQFFVPHDNQKLTDGVWPMHNILLAIVSILAQSARTFDPGWFKL
jgi:hypothetical protein